MSRFSPAQLRLRYRWVFSIDKIDEALTPVGAKTSAATAAKTGQSPSSACFRCRSRPVIKA